MSIVKVSTDEMKACPVAGCAVQIGAESFELSVNHLLEHHNYKLLHVGQETHRSTNDGELYHSTVAVLESGEG
ncbi:MAG: hypothetical protein AB2809_17085 [Candidatus Thiodiazotropha sp.]